MRQLIEEAKNSARAKETKWSLSNANFSVLDAQYYTEEDSVVLSTMVNKI